MPLFSDLTAPTRRWTEICSVKKERDNTCANLGAHTRPGRSPPPPPACRTWRRVTKKKKIQLVKSWSCPQKKMLLQCSFKRGRRKFFIAHRNVTAFFFFLTRTLACASIFISFYVFFLSSRLSVWVHRSADFLPPRTKIRRSCLDTAPREEKLALMAFFFPLPLLLLSVSLKRGGESLLAT